MREVVVAAAAVVVVVVAAVVVVVGRKSAAPGAARHLGSSRQAMCLASIVVGGPQRGLFHGIPRK